MSTETQTIMGLSSLGWDAVTALATLATAVVAGYQISSLRKENMTARTIAACERYDLDPVLDKSLRLVKSAVKRKALMRRAKELSADIHTVLNYLDQLAIGARSGAYEESTLRKYMCHIFEGHYKDLIESGAAKKLGWQRKHFEAFATVCEDWRK